MQITLANFENETHTHAIAHLLKHYSSDPMGGGESLSNDIIEHTIKGMAERSFAYSFIAWIDSTPVGLINCFEAFSTFKAKPLINIHDFVVLDTHRNQGIAQALMAHLEDFAKSKGCCKLTLEILTNNEAAKRAYQKFGFEGYELDPKAGHALFWQKQFN